MHCHPEERAVCAPKDLNVKIVRDFESRKVVADLQIATPGNAILPNGAILPFFLSELCALSVLCVKFFLPVI
jgi:hypothetical protein